VHIYSLGPKLLQ